MITIRNMTASDKESIRVLSRLHTRAFPDFFLTQLGVGFLDALYEGYLSDERSGIIVAEENGKLAGFIAYSYDYPNFYKGLIKNHLFKFAFCSMGAAIRHPSFIKRLLGAFKKSDSVVKDEKYVELASICVDPDMGKKGIGSKLIDHLKGMVDLNKFAYINLETDAVNNDGVNRFYRMNGFKLARSYFSSEGRKMNEYRFEG
ncbi:MULTISPECIES: GNAT family N-acetyltransferase [Ruminococcus]|uniref:Acetyltransferase (GNAT) family protein n=1 Tax=Ruminococcus flavefaciens TaxID=1265 RepID=A0A1M7K095_RUMFL|nr:MULTISPECIES: GNAT family N-acetyltransferase [Ruminococcus]MCR4796687.1 GNAT family N-acetyltransferase [Ruminococcus sp.]SHM58696.1 Acetyltransferase (GNAT) family protein [Ruminococcus flavefaciens]